MIQTVLFIIAIVVWHKIFSGLASLFSKKSREHKEDNITWQYRFGKNLFRNIIFTVLLSMIFHFSYDTLYSFSEIRDIEDAGMEITMQYQAMQFEQSPVLPDIQGVISEIPGFVFLNISDKSRKKWGYDKVPSLYTPRKNLLGMIQTAQEAGAKIIVVDIDLTYERHHYSQEDKNYDQALFDYFSHYDSSCQQKKKCSYIILKGEYHIDYEKQKNLIFTSLKPVFQDRVSSFLDKAVVDSTYIDWAYPYFLSEEKRKRQIFCFIDQEGQVGLSFQSKILNILSGKEVFNSKNCDYSNKYSHKIEQAIVYTLPWNNTVRNGTPILNRKGSDVLEVVSAHNYDGLRKYPVAKERLKDKIVIIGGGYQDTHPTPVGDMPGAMMIINATYSLLNYGKVHPLPLTWRIGISVIIAILITFLFSIAGTKYSPIIFSILMFFIIFMFIDGSSLTLVELFLLVITILLLSIFLSSISNYSLTGMVLFGIITLFLLMPLLSVSCLFKFGCWFNYMVPLLAVQYHQMASDFSELSELKDHEKELHRCKEELKNCGSHKEKLQPMNQQGENDGEDN